MKDKKQKKERVRNNVNPIGDPIAIPEDEIWTYQIEGLQAPHIGGNHTHSAAKKIAVVAALLVAISLSIFFSVRAIHKDTYQIKALDDGTYELVKFSNPGDVKEMRIDYVDGDKSKPITVLREYMLNCDDKLESVSIGANVRDINGKTFYSCWNLQTIFVDDENPDYCDVDGVLYTKDLSEVICCPIDRDAYVRRQNGYTDELYAGDDGYEEYAQKVLTYHLPLETTKIGMLAFNYTAMDTVYLPLGLQTIETMAFFRSVNLRSILTETADSVYPSLPDGLTYIGSDAFSYDQALTYLYIPKSVTFIGHHAFWDTVYKENGELAGIASILVQADEQTFKETVHTGDQWRPEYDYMLFKKAVDVHYGAEREAAQ